jgi:hypothetical protein
MSPQGAKGYVTAAGSTRQAFQAAAKVVDPARYRPLNHVEYNEILREPALARPRIPHGGAESIYGLRGIRHSNPS